MTPPIKLNKQAYGGKESDESGTPSNNLWVGNLSSDATDSDLMGLFANYGALDSVTTYSSRSYAFVFFKRVEDARAAKEALQGAILRGNQIKIEFARPAKPCKHLWVGGISPTVSKEQLEEEFLKFGKIEDFKFLRDRNTAFVEYFRLEDASQAMKNMNGKQIGGDQIRVDFLRSQPSRREQWPNTHDPRDGPFLGRAMLPSDAHANLKRLHPYSSGGRKGDSQPSSVLWIGYPPSVQIDEQMLHNAMILFGEIERIKSFPSRHYSFVEFRSVDEARRAKEGLQGRLFNDPRITIMFSSSDLAPGKDYPVFYSGIKGPGPDMLFHEHAFRPAHMDMFGHSHPILPTNFSGPLHPSGIIGPNMPIRPFGPQGSFEPLLSGSELSDLAAIHGLQDSNAKSLMGPNWRRPSPPAPGMLPSPAQSTRPAVRPTSGPWDVYDANQFQRDSKRSRIDGSVSVDEVSYPIRKIDDRLGLDQYALGPVMDGGASGQMGNIQGKSRISPVGSRVAAGGPGFGHPDHDYIWRGIIAKGGTPVCNARCVPIGKGIGTELPEIVNCSARTGLDMLTKHYTEAIGFEIVFFLPDSEDDFASYTEFLRYLGAKNRAGVAKFDDGTTLFLVPPSEFLTKVLKVTGPERLYGVVLKLPPQNPSSSSIQQRSQHFIPPPQYMDRRQIPPQQTEYGLIRTKEEQILPMDYGRVLHEDSKPPSKPHFPPSSETLSGQSVLLDSASNNTVAVSRAGVTLTPELIATLASFLPATSQSSAVEGAQPALGSSTINSSFPQYVAPNKVTPPQAWNQDHQAFEPAGHSLQQFNQFNPQTQLPQVQHYPSVSSTSSHPAQMGFGSTQFQESNVSLPQQGAVSSMSLTNFKRPSQSAHIAVSPPASHQYQLDVPPNTQKGYEMVLGTDSSGSYSSPVFQHPNNPGGLSTMAHGGNLSQPQNIVPLSTDKVNLELPNQVKSVLSGAGQGTSEVEVDKNQRYQSTLQFAANLLLQIQQQQQTNTPAGRGTGNRP